MLTDILKNMKLTHEATQQLVRGTSNMYWMVAFKIHLFETLLLEESPNRSNSEIRKSFLS